MFGTQLSLPEHLQLNLDPNPMDGGKTYLLVISGRMSPDADPFELSKEIPRDVGSIQFGKDLLVAINHIHSMLSRQKT